MSQVNNVFIYHVCFLNHLSTCILVNLHFNPEPDLILQLNFKITSYMQLSYNTPKKNPMNIAQIYHE